MVYPGFLAPVLLYTGIQRSVSLIYTPMRSDQAARDIRKKKVEHISDAAQRARMGQIEDAAQNAEYQDVFQQEADLTAGHEVLRLSGLVSVSAPTLDELEAATAAIEQSAPPARRPADGRVHSGGAAAVPDGVTELPDVEVALLVFAVLSPSDTESGAVRASSGILHRKASALAFVDRRRLLGTHQVHVAIVNGLESHVLSIG